MTAVAVMLYNLVVAVLLFGGCGYVVFWRGASGWWFVAAAGLFIVAAHEYRRETKP